MFDLEFPNYKRQKTDGDANRQPLNKQRRKPVLILSFVQHNLQATDPNDEQAKPDKIDSFALRAFEVRRVLQKNQTHKNREDADRQINVEYPTPRIIIGQPPS